MIERICRKLFLRRCAQLRNGSIHLIDDHGEHVFSEANSKLQVQVRVCDTEFYRRAVLGGGIGVAESLMDGQWSCDDLTALVRILIRNIEVSDNLDRGIATIRSWISRIDNWMRRNTRRGAARNIERHYDLGNDFFQLMLDESMNYSCVFFERPDTTLAAAAHAKMDRVCRKLDLGPNDNLLEIGSGWGGLAIHAAENYGCRVTTTTISREQYEFTTSKIKRLGLGDRVRVLLDDYRDLTGQFDKLVSIEMIEAVGAEYFETFFQKCADLMKPDGVMLLQGIAISEQRYQHHLRNVEFIRKYIFPGGCLPSVLALGGAAASAKLRILHVEDFTRHYERTLQCWRDNFYDHLAEIRQQGYSEHFIRMWEYYLCYCEATFAERQVTSVQMMFSGQRSAFDVPMDELGVGDVQRQNLIRRNSRPDLPAAPQPGGVVT